jgi:hypothetical protein
MSTKTTFIESLKTSLSKLTTFTSFAHKADLAVTAHLALDNAASRSVLKDFVQ